MPNTSLLDMYCQREVPYHCDVQIVSFEDRDGAEGSGLTVIHAEILVWLSALVKHNV